MASMTVAPPVVASPAAKMPASVVAEETGSMESRFHGPCCKAGPPDSTERSVSRHPANMIVCAGITTFPFATGAVRDRPVSSGG